MPRKDIDVLRALLPAAAIFVSIGTPFTFEIHSTYPVLVLTPLKLALPAAFLTYVYCFFLPHARLLLATGGVAAALYVFGPSRYQLLAVARSAWQWSRDTASSLFPKTTADWGLLGLVASFALLAIGFWVSLSRRPTPPSPSESTPAA
jgi:hypothetical protein